MPLTPGTRLGPYEILSPLGAGGMGEVYRARDTRLSRVVALKVLPTEVAADSERLNRFEQEARSASALNHPNIVAIYDVGRTEASSFIAMELVEGKTVRELLVSGPLSGKRALSIAAQAADGLAKAHAAGIVHRDLKPENLMVSSDGFVKILDFGLAKLTADRPENVADALTLAGSQTASGVIVGTVGYMSPEQASAAPLDFRSDQFSLGAILYEMATGKRAFTRATVVDTLSAILHEEPEPLASIRPDAPLALRWLIERCLSKEPDDRYASTRDLARDLAMLRDHLAESGASETLLTRPGKRRQGGHQRDPGPRTRDPTVRPLRGHPNPAAPRWRFWRSTRRADKPSRGVLGTQPAHVFADRAMMCTRVGIRAMGGQLRPQCCLGMGSANRENSDDHASEIDEVHTGPFDPAISSASHLGRVERLRK